MTFGMQRFQLASALVCIVAAVWVAACASPGSENEASGSAATSPDEAASARDESGSPEVFFTSVESGGTYPTSHEVIFDIENFDIVPVEDPLVVRQGEGHYHLAVDAECVAAGDIIPPGTPSYIHFGTGGDRITLQFDVGEHSLCLQVADGEHRVIAGPQQSRLTKQIHVTVVGQ